jgi:hypothetical protein
MAALLIVPRVAGDKETAKTTIVFKVSENRAHHG